jgi:hypothetical protein
VPIYSVSTMEGAREHEVVLNSAVDSLEASFGFHGKASLPQGHAVNLQLKGKGKGATFAFPHDAAAKPTRESMVHASMRCMRCMPRAKRRTHNEATRTHLQRSRRVRRLQQLWRATMRNCS